MDKINKFIESRCIAEDHFSFRWPKLGALPPLKMTKVGCAAPPQDGKGWVRCPAPKMAKVGCAALVISEHEMTDPDMGQKNNLSSRF